MIEKMRVKWNASISEFCKLSGDVYEPEYMEHIPRLRKRNTRGFGCHFLNGLHDINDNNLDNIVGFVLGLNWIFEHN